MKGTAAEAAQIIAEMFSASVSLALRTTPPRTELYSWEQAAIDWLREWRRVDDETPICHWTGTYMRRGPPPWC